MITRPLIFTAALLVTAASVQAENCVDYRDHIQWIAGFESNYESHDVALRGDYAYIADYGPLTVIDISDPLNPQYVGSGGTVGYIHDVEIYEHYAVTLSTYWALWSPALTVFDLSDPTHPAKIGETLINDDIRDLAISGHFAFVVGMMSLLVYDLSTPSAPTLVRDFDDHGGGTGIGTNGSVALFAQGEEGFAVLNIEDPPNIHLMRRISTTSEAQGAMFDGTMAYASTRYEVLVIDHTTPFDPTIEGSVETPSIRTNRLHKSDNLLVVASGGHNFITIDVQDPTAPVVIGTPPTPGGAEGIAIRNDIAYVAEGTWGLQIYDVSSATTPTAVASLPFPGAKDIVISGNTAVVGTGSRGLELVDITNVTSPESIADVELSTTKNIVVSDHLVFVADDSPFQAMKIVDISVPSTPEIIGILDTPGPNGGQGIDVEGDLACLVTGYEVMTVDVSEPTAPEILGTYDLPLDGGKRSPDLVGDLLYVPIGTDGLLVLNVSNPPNITLEGSIATPSHAEDVVVVGDFAYVATEGRGLAIIDISDPAAPAMRGTTEYPAYAYAVTVADSCAYIADYVAGVHVIDVRDPDDPILLGGMETPGLAHATAVVGDVIWVADRDAGLSVIPAQCSSGPTAIGVTDLAAEAEYEGIRITWHGGPDYDGFLIFRAGAENTPQEEWQVLNPNEPIPSQGPWEYLDREVVAGHFFCYHVAALIPGGGMQTHGPICAYARMFERLELFPPLEHPCRGSATIRFSLPHRGRTRVEVFDITGRQVRCLLNEDLPAGFHNQIWDGEDESGQETASGFYVVGIEWNGNRDQQRLIRLRR